MKLHYKGKYDLNPESLPHGDHMPEAIKFKEASDSKKLSVIANSLGMVLIVIFIVPVLIRSKSYIPDSVWQLIAGSMASIIIAFPHEILHAICFRQDVYLYTNWSQGLLFVVGPETMSKKRFIFMSLLPNIVFGFIPYTIGLIFSSAFFFGVFGALAIGMGAGDYYNVFNAITQMPRGTRTYLYQFNSYWYIPE